MQQLDKGPGDDTTSGMQSIVKFGCNPYEGAPTAASTNETFACPAHSAVVRCTRFWRGQ